MDDKAASFKRIYDYYEKQNSNIVVGIDGYVDEVWLIVESRKSSDDFKIFEKMSGYANAILTRGTGGMSFEIISKRRTYGGFTANTGQAAGQLCGSLTMLGMFGANGGIDPVFKGFCDNYTVHSIGEPIITTIYEFTDGKIMQSQNEGARERYWDQIVNAVTCAGLKQAYGEADVVGFGYFSQEKSSFEGILEKLIDNFLEKGKCHRIVMDFANIQHLSKERLLDALQTLAVLNKRVPISLSLNEHEGKIIFSYKNRDFAWDEPLPSTKDDIAYSLNCALSKESGSEM